MSNYLGDQFYVLEYMGHAFGDLTLSEQLYLNAEVDSIAAKSKTKVRIVSNLIAEVGKVTVQGGELSHRGGILSLLPSDIGNRIENIEVNVSASNTIPTAEIKFSKCTYENLSANIQPIEYTWHNRGAGYRVWIGYQESNPLKLGIGEYKFDCIFEGFVVENRYNYGEGGIDVGLTLNSHRASKAKIPVANPIWDYATTAAGLLERIADYLDVPKSRRRYEFGSKTNEPELKAKMYDLFGLRPDGSFDEGYQELTTNATTFYNNHVMGVISSVLNTSEYYPTCEELLNLLARSLGFIMRWHITTDGELFFGIPMNPKITANLGIPAKKIFTYRPFYTTPVKATDYLNQHLMMGHYSDFYEEISLGELERGGVPELPASSFSSSDIIKDGGKEGGGEVTEESTTNDILTGAQIEGSVSTSQPIQNTPIGGLMVKFDGLEDFTPEDLSNINREAFSVGNLTQIIGGCVPDPDVKVMDTYTFNGYSLHSGRYLVIGVTYTFQSGSRPKMSIKGITPLTVADFDRRNSGSNVFTMDAIGKNPLKLEDVPPKPKVEVSDPMTNSNLESEGV